MSQPEETDIWGRQSMDLVELMIRALLKNYSECELVGKLAELETVLRVLTSEVSNERDRITKVLSRREPRTANDNVANPIPVKSDFNCSSGGGTRVIRSGKEMT